MRRVVYAACALALAAGAALGQQVISAKSGLIHYVQGDVSLDGKPVEAKAGTFQMMKANSVLATTEGRAEVLLGPGVFVRVAENSSLTMLSNRLDDSILGLTKGSAIIEVAEITPDSSVTVNCGKAVITFRKAGVYRIDAEGDPGAQLMVYDGEALVEQSGQVQTIRKSRKLLLNGVAVAEKFDNKLGDALFRWAGRRAEYLAMANVASARRASMMGGSWRMSEWMWNPYFGMYTYMPYRGFYNSFWGYRFYSPGEVYAVFMPPQRPTYSSNMPASSTWVPAGGYHGVAPTSVGTSGVVSSTATASSSAAAAPAPSTPRGTGSEGGGRSR